MYITLKGQTFSSLPLKASNASVNVASNDLMTSMARAVPQLLGDLKKVTITRMRRILGPRTRKGKVLHYVRSFTRIQEAIDAHD